MSGPRGRVYPGRATLASIVAVMARETIRDIVRAAEHAAPPEQWVLLSYAAGGRVTLAADELDAAIRRAQLLLATGGDPRRELELYGRAVTALADDLDMPARREQLAGGLVELGSEVAGLRGAAEALRLLCSDGDLAWQCYAMSLLADALGGDD